MPTIDIPEAVQAILDGVIPVDPSVFVYGEGPPARPGQPDDLYLDTRDRAAYVWASGASCSTALGSAFTSAPMRWVKVADLSGVLKAPSRRPAASSSPVRDDLEFVKGDRVRRRILIKGVCWTPTRPEVDGVPIPDPTADNPANFGTLAVPWEEHYWFAEIRDTYVSSIRYHNGWVPWYGTYPNIGWWQAHSLKGAFSCTAEWDQDLVGTIVTLDLPSSVSSHIRASRTYRWDLESAEPNTRDEEDGRPLTFKNVRTWRRGKVSVLNDWTLVHRA